MKSTHALILTAGLLALACGSDPKEPPAAPTGETAAPTATAEKAAAPASQDELPGKDPKHSQINISDEIRKACGIGDAEARFAFNSSQIRPQDHTILGKLATCFASGPLAGRTMLLVGHTDPRGDEEYNQVLGERRAGSVKGFLVTKGLKGGQVETNSRGEDEAKGTDEDSWALDRRVDVKLAD